MLLRMEAVALAVAPVVVTAAIPMLLLPLIYEWSETRAEAKQRARDAADEQTEAVSLAQPTPETP